MIGNSEAPDESGVDVDTWTKKLDAISAAQSKFLWTLLAVGVFYWVAQPTASQATIDVPVLGIPIPAESLAATAPAVLFFIEIVIFGTMRALNRVDEVLKPYGGVRDELDLHSNAIDWAIYTTDSSPKWVTKLAGLSYAAYLGVFAAEATFFLVKLADSPESAPHGRVLLVIAALEAAVIFPFLVMHTVGRLDRFRKPPLGRY